MSAGVRTEWTEYAPRLSAEWLATDPERRHRHMVGTLVSADLSGFTAMSERLASAGKEGAERLTAIVNSCFEALISVAHRGGGDVLKFGGDALLIFFAGEEGAVRAARASAQMQRVIGGQRFAKLGLKMSVGAHHGEFDLFLVGLPDWRELVLAGRSVTRTVDLESAAAAGQVLVSRELAALLPAGWTKRKSAGGVLLDVDAVPRARTGVEDHAPPASEAVLAPSLRDEVRALESLGGEHRIVSVIFLEVEGTDESLDEVGPEEFGRGLDSLVRTAQEMQPVYGVQFLYTDVIANGIKLIATAGAPTSTVNDDEAALRFAVAIVHGDPRRRLKAGVNSGRVFAGFLGAPDRHTYTVMGDPVNLAARLMAKAEPGQVVASAEIVDGSRAAVRSQALPPFLVKGKTKPVTAMVVDEVGTERRAEVAPNELPFVGREQELALLRGWVQDVADGRGQAVELVGDAGIGKSRLVAEVADDERLFLRVSVDCQPYDANTAYAAAKVVLRRLLGIRYSASPAEAGQALRRIVSRAQPLLVPLLPLIAVPVGAEVEGTPEVDAIATDFVLARTHEAVIDLLTVVVATPTLLLVEDAYYADPASSALFAAVAARVSDRPWLLVVTTRPEAAGLLGRGAVHEVIVAPLPADEAASLAAGALHGVPEVDLAAVADRAGGNPLFVLRLMDAVNAGVATEDLPASVEKIVAERLDKLAPRDRTMLRYAAVLGTRFAVDLLDLVLVSTGQPEPDADVWDRLVDLVEVDGDHRRFRHVLYRDVAYEALPFARRGRLHQRVGELLEASSQAADVALLAEHFFRAADHERTWRYSVAAGDRAWERLAVSEAAVAYERALKIRPRVRGLVPGVAARVAEALGDVQERTASYDAADRSYRAAFRARHDDPLAAARLLRKRGVLRERNGQYELALRWYRRGQELVSASDHPRADGQLLVAQAGVLYRLGRNAEQLAVASRAADHAALEGDLETEAHACMLIQTGMTVTGEQNVEYGRRALRLFTKLENVLYQGKVLNNLGMASYFAGDWVAAADHYEEAAARFDAAGDVVESATASSNLGEILSDQGRYERATELFERCLPAYTRAHYPLGQAWASCNLGRAQARAGRGSEAITTLSGARAAFEALKAGQFVIEADLRLVEAHVIAGATDEAVALLARVAPDVDAGGGFPGSDLAVRRLRSWCLRQQGRDAEALAEARACVDIAGGAGSRFERAQALQQIAELSGDRTVVAEVASELAALGVVRLPALPVPL